MAKVIWRRQALDELDEIITYILQFDPSAAERIGTALLMLRDSLADFPRRGRPLDDGRREMVTVAPYILRYQVEGETVHILSIRHSARSVD